MHPSASKHCLNQSTYAVGNVYMTGFVLYINKVHSFQRYRLLHCKMVKISFVVQLLKPLGMKFD